MDIDYYLLPEIYPKSSMHCIYEKRENIGENWLMVKKMFEKSHRIGTKDCTYPFMFNILRSTDIPVFLYFLQSPLFFLSFSFISDSLCFQPVECPCPWCAASCPPPQVRRFWSWPRIEGTPEHIPESNESNLTCRN